MRPPAGSRPGRPRRLEPPPHPGGPPPPGRSPPAPGAADQALVLGLPVQLGDVLGGKLVGRHQVHLVLLLDGRGSRPLEDEDRAKAPAPTSGGRGTCPAGGSSFPPARYRSVPASARSSTTRNARSNSGRAARGRWSRWRTQARLWAKVPTRSASANTPASPRPPQGSR